MRKEIEVTHNETILLCDDCEINNPLSKQKLAQHKCEICKKDLCFDCIGYTESDSCYDYITVYCKSCWKIGESYKDKIIGLQEIFNREEERLLNEWHSKAKKAKGKE